MFGPKYDRVMAHMRHIRQYGGTQAAHNTYVRNAKRVVVRRTVKLIHSFPASGSGFIINSKRKSVRRLPGNGQDEGRAVAHVVKEDISGPATQMRVRNSRQTGES